jgi:hypothetical protein
VVTDRSGDLGSQGIWQLIIQKLSHIQHKMYHYWHDNPPTHAAAMLLVPAEGGLPDCLLLQHDEASPHYHLDMRLSGWACVQKLNSVQRATKISRHVTTQLLRLGLCEGFSAHYQCHSPCPNYGAVPQMKVPESMQQCTWEEYEYHFKIYHVTLVHMLNTSSQHMKPFCICTKLFNCCNKSS